MSAAAVEAVYEAVLACPALRRKTDLQGHFGPRVLSLMGWRYVDSQAPPRWPLWALMGTAPKSEPGLAIYMIFWSDAVAVSMFAMERDRPSLERTNRRCNELLVSSAMKHSY